MNDFSGLSLVLLLGALLFLLVRSIRFLVPAALVIILLAAMFPGDAAAQSVLHVAASLAGPLLAFWMLWIAIKTILGIKPNRHRCRED